MFSELTRKHGIKVRAGSPCSVEEVALAVGRTIGHVSVKSAARMNSAVVLFLEKVEQVNGDRRHADAAGYKNHPVKRPQGLTRVAAAAGQPIAAERDGATKISSCS